MRDSRTIKIEMLESKLRRARRQLRFILTSCADSASKNEYMSMAWVIRQSLEGLEDIV